MALTQTRQPIEVNTTFLAGGSIPWESPNDAISDNEQYAFATIPYYSVTEGLMAIRFNFSIPAIATIERITVRVRKKSLDLYEGPTLVTAPTSDYEIRLVKYGVPEGNNKASPTVDWTATLTDWLYGTGVDPDPLWGTTWTAAEINSGGFGIMLAAQNSEENPPLPPANQLSSLPRVDSFEITVHYFTEYNHEGEDGAVIGGQETIVDPEVMDGGVLDNGTSVDVTQFNPASDGVALLGGASPYSYAKPTSGGATLGGVAEETHDTANRPSGSILAGGEAVPVFWDYNEMEGGAEVGGEPTSHWFYGPLGGAKLGDTTADIFMTLTMFGGITLGGEVPPQGISNESRNDPAGILVGASASRSSTSNWHYEGTGSVLMGTATNYGIDGAVLQSSGGVYVSNTLSPTIAGLRFNKDVTFEWRLKSYVFKDITFTWNTGQLTMYWYRVIGEGRQGDECDLVADPCCQKYIVNVQARTPAELCEKLSERHWNWPIHSVQRFSRPAGTEDAQYYIDEHGECVELEEIEFCEIPQCADFCVDYDMRVSFQFTMSQSMDAFYVFESGDSTTAQQSVFIGGSAGVVLDLLLPDYYFESSEPFITVSGDAVASPSHMTLGGGGATLGGGSNIGFPRHSYVGGDWPSITDFKSASQFSVMALGDQVAWISPDKVLRSDGSNTHADISFNATSASLIVHNFKLGLPIDINILGIKAYVHRFSSQVSTYDVVVDLVNNGLAVSNDLARPTIAWPLIASTSWYGTTIDESDPFVPLDGTWDISMLNGDDFGVRVIARDTGNSAGAWAYIDYISLQVTYESIAHDRLRIGGSSSNVSEQYSFESSGGIAIEGTGSPFSFDLKYLPNGIGLGQPTSFVFSGSHATKLYYEVADQNTVWADSGDPVNESNKGTVAYWGTDADSVNRNILFGDEVILGGVEWQHPERALVADVNYAYLDISNLPHASDFLVVRNLNLDLDDHFEIHGIRVIIGNRFSDSSSTYEDYLYLVRGNSVISDNLASDQVWDTIPETVEYGSTGFDGSRQFRDTELNPWSVDDINDPEFGVAIAVSDASALTGTTYVKVDGIAVELTIEAFGQVETIQSHIRLIGGAVAQSNYVAGRGGTEVGGFAETKPYWNTMEGGASVGGGSGLIDDFVYEADGTLETAGEANIYSDVSLDSAGGMVTGGVAKVASNKFEYITDGNAVFILGSAPHNGTGAQSNVISIVGDMMVLEIGGTYSVDDGVADSTIDPLVETIPSCGCLAVPLTVILRHNLDHQNVFSQFLARNSYTLSSDLELFYNSPNDSWQNNAHYTGYAADVNAQEKWDLVFDLQCTDNLGGVNIGRKIWKVGVSIFRKNLNTGEDYDTRIILAVMPEAICDTNANELDFQMIYNTQMEFGTVTPENAIIYQATLYDNIGMFKNQYWTINPNLIISVSQSGFALPQTRYDLKDFVTQVDEGVPLPSS